MVDERYRKTCYCLPISCKITLSILNNTLFWRRKKLCDFFEKLKDNRKRIAYCTEELKINMKTCYLSLNIKIKNYYINSDWRKKVIENFTILNEIYKYNKNTFCMWFLKYNFILNIHEWFNESRAWIYPFEFMLIHFLLWMSRNYVWINLCYGMTQQIHKIE